MFDDFFPELNKRKKTKDSETDISRFNVALSRLAAGDVDIKLVQTIHTMHYRQKDKIDIPAEMPEYLNWILYWIHPFLLDSVAKNDTQRKMMEWTKLESYPKLIDIPYTNTDEWDAGFAKYYKEIMHAFKKIDKFCIYDDVATFMSNYTTLMRSFDFLCRIKLSEKTILQNNSSIEEILATGISVKVLPENIMMLFNIMRKSNKSLAQSAMTALTKIAERKGYLSIEELKRQTIMEIASEDNCFNGERIKVGWGGEGWRFRLSLKAGKGYLEAIGKAGTIDNIPSSARKTNGYTEAISAKKKVDDELKLRREQLEEDMNSGFVYNISSFNELLKSPIFAHLAERIIWKAGDGREFTSVGENMWKMLNGDNMWLTGIDAPFTVYPIHPIELHNNKTIAGWQRWAVDNRFTQPFRQIFREVYFPGDDEYICSNFKGREIAVNKAYALLRTVGYQPGEGVARRVIAYGITACINWAYGKSNKEIYSLKADGIVTLGDVWFEKNGEKVKLKDINPAFISEALRTADLLAAKAATGEGQLSSAETIQMRVALLRELVRAEGYTNIICSHDSSAVLIFGKLADYRVNIISGTIFLQPSGRQIELHTTDFDWNIEDNADDTAKIFGKIFTLSNDELIPDLFFKSQLY